MRGVVNFPGHYQQCTDSCWHGDKEGMVCVYLAPASCESETPYRATITLLTISRRSGRGGLHLRFLRSYSAGTRARKRWPPPPSTLRHHVSGQHFQLHNQAFKRVYLPYYTETCHETAANRRVL